MAKQKFEKPAGDEDGVHYFNPGVAEEVIASYLRRRRHTEKIISEMAGAKGFRGSVKRSPLGLDGAEIVAIRREVAGRFFDSAKLSEELREKRMRNRETYDSRKADGDHQFALVATLFARDCGAAVGKATGEFADLLAQAVIARRGRKDFSLEVRTSMWTECLSFAMELARFESAGVWIDRAWGTDPRESPLPDLYKLDTLSEQAAVAAAWSGKFKARFEESIRHASPEWLNEADRRIELRCLLSSAPRREAALDKSKRALALLLKASPDLSTRQLCSRLDAFEERSKGGAPVPRAWEKRGARSWIGAFEKFPGSVKTYISSTRRGMGLPRS